MANLPLWLDDWRPVLGWIAAASTLLLLGAALALPWALGQIPRDYFMQSPSARRTPAPQVRI